MSAMQQFVGTIQFPPVSFQPELCEERKVYLVKVVGTGWWHPIPFARRILAHTWAAERGYLEGAYEVQGFRVRD